MNERHQQIISLLHAGVSVTDILSRVRCSRATVFYVRKKYRIRAYQQRVAPAEKKQMLALYTEGHNDQEIARIMSLSPYQVYWWRHRNNLESLECACRHSEDQKKRIRNRHVSRWGLPTELPRLAAEVAIFLVFFGATTLQELRNRFGDLRVKSRTGKAKSSIYILSEKGLIVRERLLGNRWMITPTVPLLNAVLESEALRDGKEKEGHPNSPAETSGPPRRGGEGTAAAAG
jgi:hypothetical protein